MTTSSTPSGNGSPKSKLPRIELLCMEEKFSDAFRDAVEVHFPNLSEHTDVTVHNCSLRLLPAEVRFDAVVSPANSYGRLDGAFDDALAKAYGPRGDYGWITRKAQAVLYERWRGFAPPGTCTVVHLDADPATGSGSAVDGAGGQPWGTAYLLLCPTMRVPQDVRWDREIVYECAWSLLCAIDNHNRALPEAGGGGGGGGGEGAREIHSILMTPLATGCGRVSARRWAKQLVIAMRQWVEAVEDPDTWAHLGWGTIGRQHRETEATYANGI